jgi:hypothetical protein
MLLNMEKNNELANEIARFNGLDFYFYFSE